MSTTLILSGSFQEASRYAADAGLKNWRRVTSPEGLVGARPGVAIRLPGYRASHGIEAALTSLQRRIPFAILDAELPKRPAPPAYGEPGYVADLLFGDAPVPRLTSDELRSVGASEDEVELLTPELTVGQAAAVDAANKLKDAGLQGRPQDKPLRTNTTGRPSDRPTPSRQPKQQKLRAASRRAEAASNPQPQLDSGATVIDGVELDEELFD